MLTALVASLLVLGSAAFLLNRPPGAAAPAPTAQARIAPPAEQSPTANSKRWNTGSPQFSGPLDEYRALIVNHEVGHRIGHGHETCPGPGKPAPAMMQQIYGLKGCTPNAWPYSADGTYLSGPSVP
jgi:hypothetical protein